MRSFRHRRGRILFEIFGAFLIASIAAARWEISHSIRSLIVAVPLTLYGLYRIVMLFARNPALAYGDKGVQVGRLFKVDNYRWDQVREIRETVWKRPYIPFMHFLPKERHYLELQVQSGVLKIRADMIELPPGGVKEILSTFHAAQVAALGGRGAAMARLGVQEAGQMVAPVSGLQADRWQRLGIGADETGEEVPAQARSPAPLPQPSLPTRPVFGRKFS